MPRPGPAFANGTEWDLWSANWCQTCLVDAPYRNGISQWGCKLIDAPLATGEIPDEWVTVDRPDGPYTCTSYKPMGWRKPTAEPAPEPIPDGQLTLFEEG
jgi:hypothetical protein